MSRAYRYKSKPQRNIITRPFIPNTELINTLSNSSEVSQNTETLLSNMTATSSSVLNNNQYIDILKKMNSNIKLKIYLFWLLHNKL